MARGIKRANNLKQINLIKGSPDPHKTPPIMKYYTNPKHQEQPTKKVNLSDVVLLLSFTFIFILPFLNALIKTNF